MGILAIQLPFGDTYRVAFLFIFMSIVIIRFTNNSSAGFFFILAMHSVTLLLFYFMHSRLSYRVNISFDSIA